MKTLFVSTLILVVVSCMNFAGCGSSEESVQETPILQPAQQSATELVQQEMLKLRAKNDSLMMVTGKLEHENQVLSARAAELETELAESKQMQAAALQPPPPPRQQPLQAQPLPQTLSQPKVTVSHGAYEQGMQLFRARKFQAAADEFQAMLDAGGSPNLEDNCHYWLGECFYAMKRYQEAISHFNEVFSFTVSEKKDDAQMMIANSYLAMGNKERAKAEYQKLIDKYPVSPYVRRAKEKSATL